MKIALIVLLVIAFGTFSSAFSQEESRTQAGKEINSEEDIALINEYVSKKDKIFTDEDGFPLKYSVEYIWEKGMGLASSDTLSMVDGESTKYFLKLMVGLMKINLSLNGEHQATFQAIGQIYSIIEPISRTEFRDKEQYIYYPELEDKMVRYNIIQHLTRSTNGENAEINQKWINEIVKVIKESDIFNYTSVRDFKGF